MKYHYQTRGVCSRAIDIELDQDDRIASVQFTGGCNGNLSGISKLVTGRKASDIVGILRGNLCGGRPTSCPDQLAIALEEILKQKTQKGKEAEG